LIPAIFIRLRTYFFIRTGAAHQSSVGIRENMIIRAETNFSTETPCIDQASIPAW
jgi:hypothetical protein